MQEITCQVSRLATPIIVLMRVSIIDLIRVAGPFAKHLDEVIW